MSNPFFLTRQTANLMEDFTRELNQGSALFLLYGESGVGKTRLLRELSQTRLSDRTVYWLDLDSEAGNDETRMDRSAEIEALFAAAGNGDIIIADHFEISLKKSRHQLFLSWSTDGIDKQLNLIIASSTDGLEELRQLSQQYQAQVQSFEQVPFNAEEVQAFLGFNLFPDQPAGKLTIPSPLRKQIAAANGVVARLIDIVEREGDQITSAAPASASAPAEPQPGSGGRKIYALIVLLVLAVGGGWYLLGQPDLEKISQLVKSESSSGSSAEAVAEAAPEPAPAPAPESVAVVEPAVVEETMTAAGSEDESTTQAETADDSESMLDPEPEVAQQPAPETTVAVETVDTPDAEQEAPAETVTETSVQTASDTVATAQAQQRSQSEPGTVSDSEAVIDESNIENQPSVAETTDVAVSEPVRVPETSQARFELELRQSMDWIKQRDDKVGTVQILLLTYENFDADNYYEYIDNLVRRGADADKLHVFKTLTGNREVYSVVYDEFASRKAAIGAIDDLPAVIRDTSPLARSVGGLWQEIRRLEARN